MFRTDTFLSQRTVTQAATAPADGAMTTGPAAGAGPGTGPVVAAADGSLSGIRRAIRRHRRRRREPDTVPLRRDQEPGLARGWDPAAAPPMGASATESGHSPPPQVLARARLGGRGPAPPMPPPMGACATAKGPWAGAGLGSGPGLPEPGPRKPDPLRRVRSRPGLGSGASPGLGRDLQPGGEE